MLLATHDGPFHADDVLAAALIRIYVDADARVSRSRDPAVLESADIVFDVGGVFDPSRCRFDHHQRDYRGERSSAGMVLDWIESQGKVSASCAALLRRELVDYVDAVDNGVRGSGEGVPCFSTIVGSMVELADDGDFDRHYDSAVEMATRFVQSLDAGLARSERDAAAVHRAMGDALQAKRRVILLETYLKWKPAYFSGGGAEHPTDYVLFPGGKGCRVVTIPVAADSIEDKRKLPEEWGGLEDEALEEAVGIEGALFCHKNRFIAGFRDQDTALRALELWNRLY